MTIGGRSTQHAVPVGFRIGRSQLDAVMAHFRGSLPNEGVALAATSCETTGDGAVSTVRRIYLGTNTAASPTRFDMDQREIIRALREIDDAGLALGAIIHSHPRGPATPSVTDLAEAFYPEALMVIVSFAAEPATIRAWSVTGEPGRQAPVEVPIEVVSGA
jgi:proteasome lid subunit RPN8/RPN11